MATTSHLGITLLEQSQAQKEITINEALARIDAVLNSGIIDRDLATPPGSPVAGDVYIVAASPTGAWSGKAGQVAYFDQIWRFITPSEGLTVWVNDENIHIVYNGASWQAVSSGGGGSSEIALVCEGRLTLTTGVPVTASDVTGAGTVYFTPYKGSRIALYDGTSAWTLLPFSQLSLSLASGYTSGKPYDVFVYNNSGTPAIEALVWTNDTTRATALAYQNGVPVKSGATTRRYVGTFYTTSATTTEDSAAKRYVWNYQHRVARPMAAATESTASWTYATASYRQANNNSANQLNYVIGVAEDLVSAQVPALIIYNSTAAYRSAGLGIGLDSTSTNSASMSAEGRCTNSVSATAAASYEAVATVGRHYLAWLERADGSDTITFYTSALGGYNVSRIFGRVFA